MAVTWISQFHGFERWGPLICSAQPECTCRVICQHAMHASGTKVIEQLGCNAAVEDGDVDTSRDLLAQLPPSLVDTIGPEGDTLLHLACLYSHEECVKLLLEHNASVDVRDEDNSSVLHDSSAGGCASADL